MLRKITFVALSLALVALFVWGTLFSLWSPYRISAEEARQRLADGKFDVVLDVRTGLERSTLGHYPDSCHIPASELEGKVEKIIPLKTSRILVYCNTGQRARIATEKLRRMGYKNVSYIASSHISLL